MDPRNFTYPTSPLRVRFGPGALGQLVEAVAMALHHKPCRTLGGALDLPHAETHAILVPHTAAFNADTAAVALDPAAPLFGGDLGGGLHDLAVSLGPVTAQRDLGVSRDELGRIADLAVEDSYANPREVTREGVPALLGAAWAGIRPARI